MAIAVTLTSCLITQPVHFDEPPNSPPAIDTENIAQYPLNRLVHLPETSMTDAGVMTQPMMSATFSFNVYDPDVDQPLFFKVFLDRLHDPISFGTIPVSSAMTGRDRRVASFVLPYASFSAGSAECHRVTVLVSSQFVFDSSHPRDSVLPHDVASATWWIDWIGPSSSPGTAHAPLTECPDTP